MRQNVFMGSMYFLIPLCRINRTIIQIYKKDDWTRISPPPFIYNQSSFCEFVKWNFTCENTYYFASHALNGHKRLMRKINLNSFILKYFPDKEKDSVKYMFVVGTCIDKLFSPCEEDDGTPLKDLLCTKNDLVFLKKAFYETGKRGLFPTDRHHHKEFHQWLDETVSKISGVNHTNTQPTYCVVDVIGMDIDDRCWTTKQMLNNAFNRTYYKSYTPSVKNALSGNIEKFAYGILFGNDNYHRLPQNEYMEVLNNGYSNNISEVTYAANNTIFLLHTHHSYLYNPRNQNRKKSLKCLINETQNILEMCDVIYAKQKIQSFHNMLHDSNATLIKETLLSISKFISSDLFNLNELDRKMDYIYHGLGIYNNHELLTKAGELAASVEDIKATHKTNIYIILVAIITAILTLIQLLF